MIAAKILAVARMGVGSALLVAPNLSAKLFFLPPMVDTAFVAQFAGGRDLAIGALTFYAFRYLRNTSNGGERGAQETASLLNSNGALSSSKLARAGAEEDNTKALKAVMVTNVAVDAMDIVCALWAYGGGSMALEPALFFGGGADLFMSLGLYTLWRLKKNTSAA